MKLKVALCKSLFAGPVSGADEALVNYAVHLNRRGHAVTVVLLYPPAKEDNYYRRLQRANIKVVSVLQTSPLHRLVVIARDLFLTLIFLGYLFPYSFVQVRKVWQRINRMLSRLHRSRCRRVLARLRPDLLHVFTPDAGAGLMIRHGHELSIPVLYHELGTPHYRPELDTYYRELEKVLPMCDEFAALSPRLRRDWAERFPFLSFLSVLPIIVEESDRRGFLVPETSSAQTIFGYAARLEEGKGPLVLAEALAELNRTNAIGIVRLAGDGPQAQELGMRVRELKLGAAWEPTGYYSDANARSLFMRSLDVFVLPSLAEGTPNAIIEAMAHGLPVIATEVGGIPDLVTSETGVLVPAGDPEMLAQAMLRLANDSDLRERMGRAARARYLSLFSPAAVLPILENTYLRILRLSQARAVDSAATTRLHPWEERAAEI